jgi:hypothetical protein
VREVVGGDRRRVFYDVRDQREERTIPLGDRGGGVVFEDRRDQRCVTEQLRRDRGVRTDSEGAIVAARGEGRDQLPLPG